MVPSEPHRRQPVGALMRDRFQLGFPQTKISLANKKTLGSKGYSYTAWVTDHFYDLIVPSCPLLAKMQLETYWSQSICDQPLRRIINQPS